MASGPSLPIAAFSMNMTDQASILRLGEGRLNPRHKTRRLANLPTRYHAALQPQLNVWDQRLTM